MVVNPLIVPPAEDEPKKSFRKDGIGYVWDLERHQLVFRADYIQRSRDAVTASISVESTAPGVMPHVYRGRLGLESPTSQGQLVKHLEQLTGLRNSDQDDGKPWQKLIQAWCSALLKAEENTVTVQLVGNLPARERPRDLVERLLPAGKPTILYGDSSAGKGWIATAICVCLATGHPFGRLAVSRAKPLYLDWEDDEWTFNDRVQAISRGMGIPAPDIAYAQMRGPFKRHYRAIAQLVAQHGYDALVFDSVGLAAGTVGERGSYEDIAIDLFDQLRTIPAGCLLVDHINSDGRNQDGVPDKSLGSIYKRALARSQWFVKKEQDTESNVLHLGLFQTKTNHSATSKPLGFRITFENDGNAGRLMCARLESEDIREVESLDRTRFAWERIRDYLLQVRTATAPDIAEALGMDASAVRSELSRRKGVFVRVTDKTWGVLQSNVTDMDAARSGARPMVRLPFVDNDGAGTDDDLPFG